MLRRVRLPLGLVVLFLALSLTTPVLAAYHSLATDLLRVDDRPNADFFTVHSASYPHFIAQMSVAVHANGTGIVNNSINTKAYCYPPSAYKKDGWKQGLVAAFDTKTLYEHMDLCAYRFATVKGARVAYASTVKPIAAAIRHHEVDKLTGARVGDESIGFAHADFGIHGQQYVFILRRQNVILSLDYDGPSVYTATTMIQLGARVLGRLR